MEKIKVLVVDDSFFMRKMITDLLQGSGVIEVIESAKNGIEAIEKTKNLSPDIITLDVEMPKMDGMEALQNIMNEKPTPVIMLSSLTKQGADTTIRALEYGAFDFVAKPSGAISLDISKIKNDLIDKILVAYKQRNKWIRQWNKAYATDINKQVYINKKTDSQTDDNIKKINSQFNGVVAIGTSTGGPKALQEVLTKFPAHFQYPILIVQHMPPGFTNSLANRLDGLSNIDVIEAKNNDIVVSGTAYIAPGGYHMELGEINGSYQIKLNKKELISGHRPSVDVLFDSLSEINLNKIFVIMTGMGSDGTKGLIKAKKKNDIVIVQDEETCVVYGMPKSAVKSGLVDLTISLSLIAQKIHEIAQK